MRNSALIQKRDLQLQLKKPLSLSPPPTNMRAAIHTQVAVRASLAPLAPQPRRAAALAPLPKTARTMPSMLVAPSQPAPIVVAHAAPANASTAKIIVTGRHVELTAALKEYAVSCSSSSSCCCSSRWEERGLLSLGESERARERVHRIEERRSMARQRCRCENSSALFPFRNPRDGACCFPTSFVRVDRGVALSLGW